MKNNFIHLFGRTAPACGILVPRPGIEPTPPALEAQSLNHWTAREVPEMKNNLRRLWSKGYIPTCHL